MNKFAASRTTRLSILVRQEALLSDKGLFLIDNFEKYGLSSLSEQRRQRVSLAEAELVCSYINKAYKLNVHPYDIPYTQGVWQAKNNLGVSYCMIASDQLLERLAERLKVNRFCVSGFKTILKYLTVDTFRYFEINEQGTRLQGLLTRCNSSPSSPIIELVNSDISYKKIKAANLAGADFPEAPNYTWRHKNGTPTITCLTYTRLLIEQLGRDRKLNPFLPKDFALILRELNQKCFQQYSINIWGTTLATALNEFDGSPSAIVLALVNSDPDFKAIKKAGLNPYDFPKAPNSTWIDSKGRPTDSARKLVAEFIQAYCKEHNLLRKSLPEVVSRILSIPIKESRKFKINIWGTTLAGVLDCAYKNNLQLALRDQKNRKL